MTRELLWIGAWRVLSLAAALTIAAIPARVPAQGTMAEWGRALTPAEGRELRAEVGRLSRRLGVREDMLAAIARVLGANLRDIGFPELIERVQAQAGRAAELQIQISRLQTQIAALNDAPIRSPAEQVLARASAAFNEGRLDEADREFAALQGLRRSESDAARAAWADAVEARARVAELRLDYDLAEELRISAAREEQRLVRLSIDRQWRFLLGAAKARYEQGYLLGDNAALERAIVLYQNEVLPLAPRSERPNEWARTQNNLAVALAELGDRQRGTARLEQAATAFAATLAVWTREGAPLEWAMVHNNLGTILWTLGSREGGTIRLNEAARAFEAALLEYTPGRAPLEWATTQNNLGAVLMRIGQREGGTRRLEQAVRAFEAALHERTRERAPIQWAETQNNLGLAFWYLGAREGRVDRLEQSARAFEAALEERTRQRVPLGWAATQSNLGLVLGEIGSRETGTVRLEQAVRAFEAALEERTRERVPLGWAETAAVMADTVAVIAERTRDMTRLDAAERQAIEARSVLEGAEGHIPLLEMAVEVLGRIAAIRVRMASDGTHSDRRPQ